MKNSEQSIKELLAIMQELRQKCPWDREQTPLSLTRYAIEEAYEVEAAIREGDISEIRDELGDLLLQVVFGHRCTVNKVHLIFRMWSGDFSETCASSSPCV